MAVGTYALVSLAEAKNFLEITKDDENAEVERLIDAVSATFESELFYNVLTRTYSAERYCGTGTGQLRLRSFPVSSVTSVDFLQNVGSAGLTWDSQTITNLLALDTVTANTSRGMLVWYDTAFPRATSGVPNIRITYVAGESATPFDLQQAVLKACKWERKMQDQAMVGVASRSFAGQTEVITMQKDWPQDVWKVINKYRRIGV